MKPATLVFDWQLECRLHHNQYFPALPVTLIGPDGSEDIIAIVDTGAQYCLFDGQRTEGLGN